MTDKICEFQTYINGKTVSVIGIGISNRPLIDFLLQNGAVVTAHDRKTEALLGETAQELKALGVTLVLGEDYLDHDLGEVIFRTPGLRFDHPALVKANNEGKRITSEMEIFMELCPANMIAITGSDGKTTTTTLVHHLLSQAGFHTYLGGNIGTPLLSKVAEMTKDDFVVLELSSFQLHTMKLSAKTALVTNITPNHLDYHKDYEEYIFAKKNIFAHQSEQDTVVLNLDDAVTSGFVEEAKGKTVTFSTKDNHADIYFDGRDIYVFGEQVLAASDIKIPGSHNVENYMAAIGAVWGLVSNEAITAVAKTFGGVPHRIELVRELNGVRYYNSSIDSSPNRTKNTLNVFSEPVVLIAGGKDKGIPYDEIGKPIVDHVKTLILIGATAKVIYEAVEKELKKTKKELPVFFETEYEQAVQRAKETALPGDVVLLSNASTSFDMFKNFEERGNLYKELVNRL